MACREAKVSRVDPFRWLWASKQSTLAARISEENVPNERFLHLFGLFLALLSGREKYLVRNAHIIAH